VYLGLSKECILISLDETVFGWAMRVAVVQMSAGLMWTTSILFCMYIQSVTACAGVFSVKSSGENCTLTECHIGAELDRYVFVKET